MLEALAYKRGFEPDGEGNFAAALAWPRALDLFAGSGGLGIEALKELREDAASGGRVRAVINRIIRLGDVPAFIALSLFGDPFMTTLYLRKGTVMYNGLGRRDWLIFSASILLSNAYWTLRWTLIVEALRYLLNLLV